MGDSRSDERMDEKIEGIKNVESAENIKEKSIKLIKKQAPHGRCAIKG